jgi:hypothetical protein
MDLQTLLSLIKNNSTPIDNSMQNILTQGNIQDYLGKGYASDPGQVVGHDGKDGYMYPAQLYPEFEPDKFSKIKSLLKSYK